MNQGAKLTPDDLLNGPLLRPLSRDQLERIARHAVRFYLGDGESLFQQGDTAERFYLVTKGQIKLYRLSPEGNEKVIEIVTPGQTFAEALMFLNRPHYPVGATAIGSEITAPEGYAERVPVHLSDLTGKPYVKASDLFAATWDQHAFVTESGALKSLAIKLSKIAGDLILLSSGPRAGLGEINLPAMQPGSSIMPGKVNPVIAELVNVVAFRVMGNDLSVTLASQHGQLQLNAYEPIEAIAILESQTLLTNTMRTLRERCVEGITVNKGTLEGYIERTVGIVTALNPVIGYDRATELAKEAYETDKGILELIREKKVLTEEQIREILDPAALTGLDPEKYP